MPRLAGQNGAALGAEDDVGGLVVAAGLVAAEAEHAHAVGVLEDDGVVVELVAVLRLGADLAPAHAPGLHRRLVAQRPRGLVDAVDQLLGRSGRRRAS